METQEIVQQLDSLPAWARQQAEDFIAFLQTRYGEAAREQPARPAEGAILLPPLDMRGAPTTWPENPFMNPEFFGAWADRTDVTDSTEFVRQLRREQWGPKS